MRVNSMLIRPIVTEKATQMVKNNIYAFEVNVHVNKHQIASLLELMYKVKIGEVRVITRSGKVKKVGKAMKSKQLPDKKIAYVTLESGKIDIFPQT